MDRTSRTALDRPRTGDLSLAFGLLTVLACGLSGCAPATRTLVKATGETPALPSVVSASSVARAPGSATTSDRPESEQPSLPATALVDEREQGGDTTLPVAPAIDDILSPDHIALLYDLARDLVEARTATDLSRIGYALVDDAAMVHEVGLETRRLVEGRLGKTDLADRLLDALLDGQAGTYAALYAGRQKQVLISRDVLARFIETVPRDAKRRQRALLVLMLHELVHAADDLRHAIHANRTLDFRASFAQSAAFEGHAQWQTREICRTVGCLDGLDALDAFMFGKRASSRPVQGGTLSNRLDPIGNETPSAALLERNLLEYSYVEGERFVEGLAARRDGAHLLDELLSNPPHDPLQILNPASFPDDAREQRNRRLIDTATAIDHPWLDGTPGEQRVGIETSPLKGVNLRGNPDRRQAAIDGFTRLVIAMAAIQFHDPQATRLSPVEVTLMRTDTSRTAELFASTLQAHARLPGSTTSERTVEAGDDMTQRLLRTETPSPTGRTWFTAIGTAGPFVVQASGHDTAPEVMDTYVLGVLAALLSAPS